MIEHNISYSLDFVVDITATIKVNPYIKISFNVNLSYSIVLITTIKTDTNVIICFMLVEISYVVWLNILDITNSAKAIQ